MKECLRRKGEKRKTVPRDKEKRRKKEEHPLRKCVSVDFSGGATTRFPYLSLLENFEKKNSDKNKRLKECFIERTKSTCIAFPA